MFFFFLFTVKPFAHLNALKRGAWERGQKKLPPTGYRQCVGAFCFLLNVQTICLYCQHLTVAADVPDNEHFKG